MWKVRRGLIVPLVWALTGPAALSLSEGAREHAEGDRRQAPAPSTRRALLPQARAPRVACVLSAYPWAVPRRQGLLVTSQVV